MKDAFERRALLLHLGDALQAIAAALAADASHRSVRDLLNAHTALAAQPWLAAIMPDTATPEFAKRASASFAQWPALLLEERVDYTRLALAVRDTLFADDSAGWRRYVEAIRREVAWFADELPSVDQGTQADQDPEHAPAADEAENPVDAGDVERAAEGGDAQRDSVESDARLYPSWPWKPV